MNDYHVLFSRCTVVHIVHPWRVCKNVPSCFAAQTAALRSCPHANNYPVQCQLVFSPTCYATSCLFDSQLPRVFARHPDHRKRGKMESTIAIYVHQLCNPVSYQFNSPVEAPRGLSSLYHFCTGRTHMNVHHNINTHYIYTRTFSVAFSPFTVTHSTLGPRWRVYLHYRSHADAQRSLAAPKPCSLP